MADYSALLVKKNALQVTVFPVVIWLRLMERLTVGGEMKRKERRKEKAEEMEKGKEKKWMKETGMQEKEE